MFLHWHTCTHTSEIDKHTQVHITLYTKSISLWGRLPLLLKLVHTWLHTVNLAWSKNSHSFCLFTISKILILLLSFVTEETAKCKSERNTKQMPYSLRQQWKIHNVEGNLQASKPVLCCFSCFFLLLSSDFSVCMCTCTLRDTNITHFDCCQQLMRPSGLSVVWTNTHVYAGWWLMLEVMAVMLPVTSKDLCQH